MNAPHRNHHNSGLSQNKSSCAGSVRKYVCLPATAGAVHQRLLTTFYPEHNVPLCLCAVGLNSERERRDRQIEEIKTERVEKQRATDWKRTRQNVSWFKSHSVRKRKVKAYQKRKRTCDSGGGERQENGVRYGGGLSCGRTRNVVFHSCLQRKPHVYLFFL